MNNWSWIPNYATLPINCCMPDRAKLVAYWDKYLLQRAISVIKVTLPDSIDKDYFMYTLFLEGFIPVFYTTKFGLIAQKSSLLGYGLYDKPTHIEVNTTLVQNVKRQIDKNCVLFTCNPDFTGIFDIINYYALQLAEFQLSIDVNLYNSKLAYIFGAENKKEAENMKKAIDMVVSGEPAIFTKSGTTQSMKSEMFLPNVKNTYMANQMLIDMRKVIDMFDTEVGLPNANTDKKERMVVDEINSNNTETKSRMEYILERLNEQAEKASNMFGEPFKFEFREKEVKEDGVKRKQSDII